MLTHEVSFVVADAYLFTYSELFFKKQLNLLLESPLESRISSLVLNILK